MLKLEFLEKLRKGLSGLPQEDIDEYLSFYREMIDDRMEEGLSEEDAVAAVGSVDEIVAQAVADTPLSKIAKERIRQKRRIGAGEILLLILGAPIWLSLGIAVFSVILSLYASLWIVFISVAAASIAVIAGGATLWFIGDSLPGVAMIGAGISCVGISIFVFFGCKAVTAGLLLLTKKLALGIKNRFLKKEVA